MKQIILGKTFGNAGFTPYYTTLRGYQWSQSNIDGAAAFRHSHPWSVEGTFSNLYVEILAPVENASSIFWTDTTFTLYINGVATALTVTVPAAGPVSQNGFQSSSQNITDVVSVSPGDTLSLRRTPADTLHGNVNAAYANIDWSLTFESANAGESGYGSGAGGTKINLNSGTYFCAPLNAQLSAWIAIAAPDTIDQTQAHSIVPIEGSLFRVDMEANSALGSDSVTFFCYVNGVKQDGTGGTVDTAMTLTGAGTKFPFTFDLPLSPLDWLSIHIDSSLSSGTFNDYITVSCGFRATTDGQSAFCYNSANGSAINDGSTDWASIEGSGWAWQTSASPTPPPSWRPSRWPCTELLISLPGAIDPYTLSGFCMNLSTKPGVGKSYLFKTRKAFTDTLSTVTMTGTTDPGDRLNTDPLNGSVVFSTVADRLDIQVVATGTPTTAHIGWSWLMTASTSQMVTEKSHVGTFYQGQQGAVFTVISTNVGDIATSGEFTVTETLPAGLTLVSMVGEGWTVVGNVASRSDALAPGASYPPLYVTVNVASDATSPQCNIANEAEDCAVIGVRHPTPIVTTHQWLLNRFDTKPKGGQQA
jgi:uncharacterized repeat protein (TIGR01451 family)